LLTRFEFSPSFALPNTGLMGVSKKFEEPLLALNPVLIEVPKVLKTDFS
jgi:hypothetical protein